VKRESRTVVVSQASTPEELRASEELVVQVSEEGPGKVVKIGPQVLATRSPEKLTVEVSKMLDLISSSLGLQTPHPSTASHVRGGRTVSREFVLSMLAAAERNPDDPILQRFDSDAARRVLQSTEAYRLLSERMAMFLASVNYTVEADWADVAADALQTFKIASIMSGDTGRPELAAEVENLREKLGRKGPARKKKAKKED
jgi:hypothetical protein